MVWFTVLPGAPRMPRSWLFTFPHSPMNAKFWFPNGSICDAPMITCRRPDHTTSNIVR